MKTMIDITNIDSACSEYVSSVERLSQAQIDEIRRQWELRYTHATHLPILGGFKELPRYYIEPEPRRPWLWERFWHWLTW